MLQCNISCNKICNKNVPAPAHRWRQDMVGYVRERDRHIKDLTRGEMHARL